MASLDRPYDLVLLGATGFVGRLTATQLALTAPANLRIALAGRGADRLRALRADLGARAAAWGVEVADVSDASDVARLVRSTRVVLSTVGPYAPRGLPLVRGCAEAGTDYADLTGETLFVRRSIDQADAVARDSGARLVHACGFDSVPSDLGVGLAAARAAADGTGRLASAVLHVRALRGGISGGTVDTLRQQTLETRSDPALARLVANPSALVDRAGSPGAGSDHRPVSRDPATGRWSAPFVMGGFNRQIVLRSGALAGGTYARGFDYREVVDTGTGPRGAVAAAAVAAASAALLGGMALAPTRRVLDRVLPDPGQGPSERTRRGGRFVVEVEATTTGGARYRTRVGAAADPAYDATAVMLSQAGLSLATDPRSPGGGVLTPMAALGQRLADRLRARGFTVETERLG